MIPSRFAVGLYVFGALSALVAVALAALASHGLSGLAPTGEQAVVWFKLATSFQLDHALGVVLVTVIAEHVPASKARTILRIAAVLLAVAFLFPLALYSLSFHGPGFFAPYGGFAAMAGWALFAVGAVFSLKAKP
jgi:uncharacterized membrane protein YgdD (TMEM256/DUF423 family)